jgi:hypothetical protein
MDTKDYVKDLKEQAFREFEPRIVAAQTQGELNPLTRQFERRIGRPLSSDERDALAVRVKAQGSTQLADLVLDLSGPELAAWLEKNGVAKND